MNLDAMLTEGSFYHWLSELSVPSFLNLFSRFKQIKLLFLLNKEKSKGE